MHVLVGDRVGELLQQLALLAAQPSRDDDVGHHAQVAAAARAPQARHPVAAHGEDVAGLRSRRHLDLDVAVQRRHRQLGAQRGQRGGHVEDGHEVVAVAQEALIGRDPHEHVEVAGRAAALAGVAAPGEADALAVGDPGRDVDTQRAPAHLAPAAVAALARLLGDAALAVADVARHLAHDLAEGRARHRLQHPHAPAALAGDDRRAGLGAVAVTALAQVDRLEAQVDARAGCRLGQRDVGVDGDVSPGPGRPPGPSRPPPSRRRTRRTGPRSTRSPRSSARSRPCAARRGRSGRRSRGAPRR